MKAPHPSDWVALRYYHDLTQEALGLLIHRSKFTVAGWELGSRPADNACWHLALLLLGEVPPGRASRAARLQEDTTTRARKEVRPQRKKG